MGRIVSMLFLGFVLTFNVNAFAAGSEKGEVQAAMKQYVRSHTVENGLLPVVYQGKVLQLKLATSAKYPDGFHSGVQQKGNLYASCADFVEPKTGKKYDIDFLVNQAKGNFAVVQPIVHSIDGKKSPYDLAH